MALSDIVLGEDLVLVTPLPNTSVVFNYGTLNVAYGRVQLVNQNIDMYKAGHSVIYNNSGAIALTYSGVSYFLINQSSIKLIAP